jgi:DNA-binding CsgD family transcriptional regulator/pimeloyl-ACP methyl ester carboxylesterase
MRVPRISYARGADGVSLAFTAAGTGPALVFVPWVPFSNFRMEWQNPLLNGVFEQMAARLTLVHYDGRGTGHSQRDVSDLSFEAMVADLEAVVDRAGLAELSLLGQYNSCPHAIAYASRHPERVKRMVLFAGSARGWDAMSARKTQAMLSLIEQDWDLFADTAAHQWMGWSAGEAGHAVADAIREAVTPQVARATMQAASAADVTELLPGVAARTLVLHPRDMAQIPVAVARSLAMGLPRGRLVLLDGAQPVLFGEDPDQVVSLLTGFFRDGIEPAGEPPAGAAAGGHAVMPSDGLTRRELEVLRLVAGGESNAQIARRLGLSTHTVERHVANLYRKIGARGRADATAYALRSGLA